MVVEGTKAGPYHGSRPAKWPPCKANSRCEVVLVGCPKPAADVGPWTDQQQPAHGIDVRFTASRNLDCARRRIERSHFVDALHGRKIEFVPDAEIEREARRHLPIILEVIARRERHRIVERLTQVPIGLSGHPEQEIRRGESGERSVEIEGATTERSEERIEQKAPDIEPVFDCVRAQSQSHVVDVVVRVIVAALRQVRWAANYREPGNSQLRRTIVERRLARIREPPDPQPPADVDVTILPQPEKPEARIPHARLVHQSRLEQMPPVRQRVLRTLQFITAPARHVARRAERIGQRVELRGIGELICRKKHVSIAEPLIGAHRELVDIEPARSSGNEVVLRIHAVRIGIQSEQSGALGAPQRLGDLVVWKWLIVAERIADGSAEGAEVAPLECGGRNVRQRGLLLSPSLALVTDKEKSPVTAERASEYAA